MGGSAFPAYLIERRWLSPSHFSSIPVPHPWWHTKVTWESSITTRAPGPAPGGSDLIDLCVIKPESTFYIWCICHFKTMASLTLPSILLKHNSIFKKHKMLMSYDPLSSMVQILFGMMCTVLHDSRTCNNVYNVPTGNWCPY